MSEHFLLTPGKKGLGSKAEVRNNCSYLKLLKNKHCLQYHPQKTQHLTTAPKILIFLFGKSATWVKRAFSTQKFFWERVFQCICCKSGVLDNTEPFMDFCSSDVKFTSINISPAPGIKWSDCSYRLLELFQQNLEWDQTQISALVCILAQSLSQAPHSLQNF